MFLGSAERAHAGPLPAFGEEKRGVGGRERELELLKSCRSKCRPCIASQPGPPDGCVQVSPSSSSHLEVFLLSYQEISVYLLSSRRPLCQAAASSRG